MADEKGQILRATDSATAATHPESELLPVLIAPSTGREFNTVFTQIAPTACFKLEDSHFEFDSSFVNPMGLTFDAGPLKTLLDKHPGAKLSVFGHADPVGRDDFNKVLSGRRAQAIFGMLVRDVKLWEDLYYQHDNQGKDKWGVKAVQIMLNLAGPTPAGTADGIIGTKTRTALKDFESANGLPAKGFNPKKEIDRGTFKELALLYMDKICLDDDGNPFKLTSDDFLARGKGKDGKGDFQGCGEFNPLLIFSKEEKSLFDKKENKKKRESENQPNRRVMILLFRAGSQIDPIKWPCPSVKEGIKGCQERFFSDGEERRSNKEERRTFEQSQKDPAKLGTFACRFYQRLTRTSPCETFIEQVDIRLYDAQGNFMPDAPFRLFAAGGGELAQGFSNAKGHVILKKVPSRCTIAWGFKDPESPNAVPKSLPFRLALRLDFDQGADDEQALRCLNNLGYVRGATDADNIAEFQADMQIPLDGQQEVEGKLGPQTKAKILQVHRERADQLR